MPEVVAFVAGAAIVALVLSDIFLTIVVPRRAPTFGRQLRVSNTFVAYSWRIWKSIGFRFSNSERREGFLGLFGALAVVVLLDAWVVLLVFGYGLMLFALRGEMRPAPETIGAAIYFAGVSLLTVGFGDVVPLELPARVISLVAAGNGL